MSFVEIYVLLLAIVLGCGWLAARKIKRDMTEVEDHMRKVLDKIIFMHVEHHDNLMFAYNAVNKEFVCQGTDLDDLNVQFGKRFPEHRGIIVEPEGTANVL